MQTILNTIIDRARQSRDQASTTKTNPYPSGTLRSLAHEIGLAPDGCAVVATRADGQIFGVMEIEDGQFQSVVPSDLAAQGEGYVHACLEGAVDYVRDLAASHGLHAVAIAA